MSGRDCGPGEAVVMLTLTIPGDEAHALSDGTTCACTPVGGINVAEENALFGRHFNRLIQALRRRYDQTLQYARVVEIQLERGALHAHVLIRTTAADAMLADFTTRDPHCPMRALIVAHGFGHETDLVATDENSVGYVIKYVTKTAGDRSSLNWLDFETGEIVLGNDRYRVWTASRRWGTTMREVREVQAHWARKEANPAESTPEEA